MKPFADAPLDLLQNIEFEIVEAYKENSAITDFDVTEALDALTRQYAAEAADRRPSVIPLDPLAQTVYRHAKQVCEWRLGRLDSEPAALSPASLSELVTALRTIMKSVRRWSGRGGKRGYLEFVKPYVP